MCTPTLLIGAAIGGAAGAASGGGVKGAILGAALGAAGGAVLVDVSLTARSTGYFVVKTTNEVPVASLQIVAQIKDKYGGVQDLCALTAITTNTTILWYMGGSMGAGAGVAGTCDFPLPSKTTWVFTVTGASASFNVEAYFEAVAQTN